MTKYRLYFKNGGLELFKTTSGTGNMRSGWIICRFNFRKPYGYHRIKK